jgi:hypothetical protein
MKKLLFTLALLMSFVSFGQRIEKNLLNDNYSLWRTAEETIRYNQLNNIIYKKTIADNGMVKILFYQKIESDYVVNYWFYTASSNGAFYKIEKTILFFSFSKINTYIFFNDLKRKISTQFENKKESLKSEFYTEKMNAKYEKISTDVYTFMPRNGLLAERYVKFGLGNLTMDDGTVLSTIYTSISSSVMEDLISSSNKISKNSKESKNKLRFTIGGVDLRDLNQYDLEAMVKFFLEDCKKNNITVPSINSLEATFVPLKGSTLALAYGYGDDSIIKIKVDPEKWNKSSIQKRWYVLYHELGHDVLNLEHGQGGKMMFNFADRENSWDEFFEDKQYMLKFK